jgi:hypothetical protein
MLPYPSQYRPFLNAMNDRQNAVMSPLAPPSGTPDWMLNVSTLNALPFPEPLTFNGSKLIHPDARSGAYPNITCGCVPSAACDQARAFGIFAAYG